jgi:hypothetical protein
MDVTSGVPQGSVLGPLLFLVFINDLDSNIVNRLLKFADDSKLFGKVTCYEECCRLQHDLDNLIDWADTSLMEFNISKCHVMHVGKDNARFTYFMKNQQLEVVSVEKDLGVVFSQDMKFESQCVAACNKANMMLGMMKRSMSTRNFHSMVCLYKSIVRPHLEYCSSVWNPHYQKDKELIERVQHRFSRLFRSLRPLSYMDRLDRLGLWTLEERRNRADLVEVFKIVKRISSVPLETFFTLSSSLSTREHSMKLQKSCCSSDPRLYFFSMRVVNRWNALPQSAVEVDTVDSFKRHLSNIRKTTMDFFMDQWSN